MINNNQIQNYDFCIIGAGKLGLTLAKSLSSYNLKLSIIARSADSYRKASSIIDTNLIFKAIDQLFYIPKVFILSVRDSQIREVADYLAKIFKHDLNNRLVIHCSGILDTSVLDSCKALNAITASLHPYQTFYLPDENLLNGISWGVQSEFDIPILYDFIRFIKGTPVNINSADKVLYHLSAVAVSNYLNSTLALGNLVAKKASIELEEFALPIIKQTVANAFKQQEANQFPLTGPIARADLETIRTHINSIKYTTELLLPYCYLGLATLEITKNSPLYNPEFYSNARLLLLNAISEQMK